MHDAYTRVQFSYKFSAPCAASIVQVVLLVAGINYVLEVEATLEQVDEGNNRALTGYQDLQVNRF